MPDVETRISSAKKAYAHGETLRLSVKVTNRSGAAIAAVVDRWLTWLPTPDELMVLVGVPPLGAVETYNAFRAPRLRTVSPGRSTRIALSIGMPPIMAEVDAAGSYVKRELAVAADLRVTVRAGYVPAGFKPEPDGYWSDFVAQQELAQEATIRLSIGRP